MLGEAFDLHVEFKFGLRIAGQRPGDWRCIRIMRRGGERDVAFTREKAGSWIKTDPACAWQIGFAPGMQVCEIMVCSWRTIQRNKIWFELDQIAGHKTCGDAQSAKGFEPAANWNRDMSPPCG